MACQTCRYAFGMFTANSMNCLMEALGLALPGNGTLVATHADRRGAFPRSRTADRGTVAPLLRAGRRGGRAARHHDFDAFENAMSLDIAMGGSTNTVLHLLAAAQEAGVPFTMRDIDRLSRRCRTSARSRHHRPRCTWRTCITRAAFSGAGRARRIWPDPPATFRRFTRRLLAARSSAGT